MTKPRRLRDPIYPWSKVEEAWDQSKLIWFVKEPSYQAGILPYAKSTGWFLPGHGSAYSSCGKFKTVGCNNVSEHPEGKVFGRYYKASCMRKSCPECFEGWSAGEAERSLIRLTVYMWGENHVSTVYKNAKKHTMGMRSEFFHTELVCGLEDWLKKAKLKPIHVVLSPDPKTDFSKKMFEKLRCKAYKVAKKSGLFGGIMVFHPYRLHCKKCDVAIPDYNKKCSKCQGEDFQWVKSPHFHVVGFGWIKPVFKETGWVVRNLGVRRSVFWTLQYLLSHAGVFVDPEPGFKPKTFHTSTWFGKLSYNKLKSLDLQAPKPSCPYCGAVLMPMEFTEGLDRPPPFDPENESSFEFLIDSSSCIFGDFHNAS
jgi:hypothetical protein